VIILLTDGEDTSSRPSEMAAEAAKLGVRIYSVAIGSKSGEPIQKFNDKGEPDGYQTDDKGNYLMTRVDEEGLKKARGGDRRRSTCWSSPSASASTPCRSGSASSPAGSEPGP
jgi:Ca-activated chloride channel family protein